MNPQNPGVDWPDRRLSLPGQLDYSVQLEITVQIHYNNQRYITVLLSETFS